MTLFTTGFLQSVTAVQKQLFKHPIQKLLKKLETTHIGYFYRLSQRSKILKSLILGNHLPLIPIDIGPPNWSTCRIIFPN